MKVGTDGVLLGAWSDITECENVLDIGTGTGLIALMIAQRNAKSVIDAIDIDERCIMQARQNVIQSSFAARINVQQQSFQGFAQQIDKKYDLIISNPPYFQNALKSPLLSRSYARHADTLSFYDVVSKGVSLLAETGRIVLILPHEFKQAVLTQAATVNLYAYKITNVFPVPHKPPKRLLIELRHHAVECVEDDLVIERERHKYTEEYIALTKDFYLEK